MDARYFEHCGHHGHGYKRMCAYVHAFVANFMIVCLLYSSLNGASVVQRGQHAHLTTLTHSLKVCVCIYVYACVCVYMCMHVYVYM